MSYIGKKPVDFNDVTEAQTFTVTGDLTVDTNTLFVDSTNNNVGIGTTSPVRQLHVNAGSENVYLHLTNAATGTTTTDGLSILVKNSNSEANIIQREAAALTFSTSGTERARILSGGGLTFNGDTATTNALDDYEKGNWTPAYSISGATFSHGIQSGKYVKVGDMVVASCRIRGQRSGGSGDLVLNGLPYATSSLTNLNQAASIGFTNGWSTSPKGALTGVNSTAIVFKKSGSTSALSNITDDVTHSDVSTSSTSSNDLILTVAYVAA